MNAVWEHPKASKIREQPSHLVLLTGNLLNFQEVSDIFREL